MIHGYDIILTAQISVHGIFMGETAQDAIDTARGEMLVIGQIDDINVERAVLLEDTEMPNLWQGPMPEPPPRA